MSTYYYMGCKTCEKKLDMATNSRIGVIQRSGEFALKHAFHDLILVNDNLFGEEGEDWYHIVTKWEDDEE